MITHLHNNYTSFPFFPIEFLLKRLFLRHCQHPAEYWDLYWVYFHSFIPIHFWDGIKKFVMFGYFNTILLLSFWCVSVTKTPSPIRHIYLHQIWFCSSFLLFSFPNPTNESDWIFVAKKENAIFGHRQALANDDWMAFVATFGSDTRYLRHRLVFFVWCNSFDLFAPFNGIWTERAHNILYHSAFGRWNWQIRIFVVGVSLILLSFLKWEINDRR